MTGVGEEESNCPYCNCEMIKSEGYGHFFKLGFLKAYEWKYLFCPKCKSQGPVEDIKERGRG